MNSPASQSSRGEYNSNMVEISVDTSSFVDIRQQDSGSNQSGSDSGLGYTNSISSDNSTFNNTAGQEQTKKQDTTTSSAISHHYGHTSASSSTAALCSKSELGSIDETKTSTDDAVNKQSLFKSGADTHQQHHQQQQKQRHNNNDVNNNNADYPAGRSDAPKNESEVPIVPVIKSLLKKSSRPNDVKPKHNRSVSFNQTVIVFCEEIEAPSPGDQYEPPIGYQDSSTVTTPFEPPEDYCDHKSDRKEVVESSPGDDDDRFNRAIGDGGTNLTDDQLIGLLENESLLETFKLNCDDFSEDDFPINRLNSNHGYLGNDAISDYDTESDSESSLCVERRDFSAIPPVINSHSALLEQTNSSDAKLSKTHERTQSSSIRLEDKTDGIVSSSDSKTDSSGTTIKSNIQKSMPARMKVSAVDNSHIKRQSTRKEDHDLKPKPERTQSDTRNEQQASHKMPQADNARSMLIKQSTVEPIAISKPMIVTSNIFPGPGERAQISNKKLNVDTLVPTSQTLMVAKPSDQIKNDFNQTLERVSLPQKHTSQPGIINSNQVQAAQSQPACHICRVIESNRSQINPETINVTLREDLSKITTLNNNNQGSHLAQSNQFQTIKTATTQPAVFNESCVSCREASMKHNVAQNAAQARNAGIAQATRPVAYQLVYVVDQNGNRVRALSLLRPGIRNQSLPGQQPIAGRRIFIASQNGVRFPNPVSMTGQIINLPSNQVPHPNLVQNFNINNQPQQYRIVGSAQPLQPQQFLQNQPNNMKTSTGASIQQRIPMDGLGLRQHTVYYVRQPLDTQNIRQSFDSTGSNSKSFPDPHEIRRLDGLRGPTSALNLSQKVTQGDSSKISGRNTELSYFQQPADTIKRVTDPTKDEADDPTFGFSKRPSVKVVATSSNSLVDAINMRSRTDNKTAMNQEQYVTSNNMTTICRATNQPGNMRPVSLVVMGSQTLDRRNLNHQAAKENIPSTSSMSNIHGTFTAHPNRVSVNTSQQQRISGSQIVDLTTDNLKTKEPIKPNDLVTIRSESNKGVIVNSQVVPLVAQGRQTSSLNENHVQLGQHRRAQEQKSEVAYSMNI